MSPWLSGAANVADRLSHSSTFHARPRLSRRGCREITSWTAVYSLSSSSQLNIRRAPITKGVAISPQLIGCVRTYSNDVCSGTAI